MPHMNHNGIELWYDVQGEGEPLILTGGWGFCHDQFEFVTPILAEDFTVVNWNWRGVGNSDRSVTHDYSVESWSDDLAAVLGHLGIDTAFFWATSTGTMINIRHAAKRPESVRKLATYIQFKSDFPFRRAYLLFPKIFELFGYESLAYLFTWMGMKEEKITNSLDGVRFAQWEAAALARNLGPLNVAKTCEAIAHTDLTWDLPRLKMPWAIVAGDEGILGLNGSFGAPMLADMQEAIPHLEVLRMPGAGGTYCMREEPEECARIVKQFMLGA